MSGQQLSRISKLAPMPDYTMHSAGNMFNRRQVQAGYVCHTAALHWAIMSVSPRYTHNIANQYVSKLTEDYNKSKGFSISAFEYGKNFCATATRITQAQLYAKLRPGDLLITGDPSLPNHTMIVRQVRRSTHVTIRGFNNQGTLGTGQRLKYDPVSHNITKDKYWNDDGTRFGIGKMKLFYIRYENYVQALKKEIKGL